MTIESSHLVALANILGGWEIVLVLAVLLILIGARNLPEITGGLRKGLFDFGKQLDEQAHDAGRSAGGIFGKPAAEALNPANETAELYDPAVFHQGSRRLRVRDRLKNLLRNVLTWLRNKH